MSIGIERPRSFEARNPPDTRTGLPGPRAAGPESSAPPGPSPFANLLSTLGSRIDQGESLMRRASQGDLGRLDAGALIAVQAGIYRYVEAVDLAARLVDRAGTAVRQVLQSGSQ